METEDGGRSRQHSQRRPCAGRIASSCSEMERTDQSVAHNVKSVNPRAPVSSVMRAQQNLSDEDEQGGKFQQVEGLTTVDAEEIPCEFSVEDDFLIDENAEGIDEEMVKAIVAGNKIEFDATVCEELPKDAKIITTRWENVVPKGEKWRCRFVAREFRHDDPEVGLDTSGSKAATGKLVDMHAVQHGHSILCLDAENAYFHAQDEEEVYCCPPKEWVKRYHARGSSGESLVEVEETASRETESCEVQRVCRDGDRWSRHRAMSRAAITLQMTKNDIDLRVPP